MQHSSAPAVRFRGLLYALAVALVLLMSSFCRQVEASVTFRNFMTQTVDTRKGYDLYGSPSDNKYKIEGPVTTLQVVNPCKVVLPSSSGSSDRSTSSPFSNSILVVSGLKMYIEAECTTHTQILKQLQGDSLDSISKSQALPPIGLILLPSRANDTEPFGGVDEDLPDNRWSYPVKVPVMVVGADTASMIAAFAERSLPVTVNATQDDGPWNQMLASTGWKVQRILTYVWFGLCLAYALYQIVMHIWHFRLSFINFRGLMFLDCFQFLLVSILVKQGETHNNAFLTINYISWWLGLLGYVFFVVKWYTIVRRIFHRPIYYYVLLFIAVLVSLIFTFAMGSMLAFKWSLSHTWGNITKKAFGLITPISFWVFAAYCLYLAVLYIREIKRANISDATRYIITRMTYLLILLFFGFTILGIVIYWDGNEFTYTITGLAVKVVTFTVASGILFTSIFLMLQIQDTLPAYRFDDAEIAKANANGNIKGVGTGGLFGRQQMGVVSNAGPAGLSAAAAAAAAAANGASTGKFGGGGYNSRGGLAAGDDPQSYTIPGVGKIQGSGSASGAGGGSNSNVGARSGYAGNLKPRMVAAARDEIYRGRVEGGSGSALTFSDTGSNVGSGVGNSTKHYFTNPANHPPVPPLPSQHPQQSNRGAGYVPVAGASDDINIPNYEYSHSSHAPNSFTAQAVLYPPAPSASSAVPTTSAITSPTDYASTSAYSTSAATDAPTEALNTARAEYMRRFNAAAQVNNSAPQPAAMNAQQQQQQLALNSMMGPLAGAPSNGSQPHMSARERYQRGSGAH